MAFHDSAAPIAADDDRDPYLWLEDVTGDEALDWVRARNEPTLAEFGDADFEQMRTEALEVLDTDARIPYVRRRGEYLYNFWRDAANPRGLWRRTTLDSYRSDSPDWDVLIDVDELGRTDDEKWVWAGADVIEPEYTRALVSLSRGGSDAIIVREFDMRTREFVADGFELPEAKSQLGWADADTVLVGTDFGADSLTESGYPRIDQAVAPGHPAGRRGNGLRGLTHRRRACPRRRIAHRASNAPCWVAPSTSGTKRSTNCAASAELIRIDVPTDASVSIHRDWLLIELRTDWTVRRATYPGRFAAGGRLRRIPGRHSTN